MGHLNLRLNAWVDDPKELLPNHKLIIVAGQVEVQSDDTPELSEAATQDNQSGTLRLNLKAQELVTKPLWKVVWFEKLVKPAQFKEIELFYMNASIKKMPIPSSGS